MVGGLDVGGVLVVGVVGVLEGGRLLAGVQGEAVVPAVPAAPVVPLELALGLVAPAVVEGDV